MSLLVRNETILAKIESTYNTDSSPDATNAVAFMEVSGVFEGLRLAERPLVKQGLDTNKRLYAGSLKALTFTVELKGSGTAGTAPEIGPLLRSCGLDETIVASTSVTYAPVSSGLESCTIYYYEEGIRYIMTGCRGSAVFNVVAGEVAKVTFTMTGHRSDPTDNAAPTPTYDATIPVPLIGIPFTVGGYSAVINEFTLDLANQIATVPSLSASDGYGDVQVTSRDPGGTFDPESVLVATDSVIADFTSQANKAISIGAIGTAAGNIVDLDLPAAYYVDVAPGERENIRTKTINYRAGVSSGDDELSLAFT